MIIETHGVTTEEKVTRIQSLDLGAIVFKLVVDDDGPEWSREKAESVETMYKQYLVLCAKHPDKGGLVPYKDVDTFWHYHILDTRKYAEDCEHCFGGFLHHFPYLGMRGPDDVVKRQKQFLVMVELLGQEFGTKAQCYGGFCLDEPDCDGSQCMEKASEQSDGGRPSFGD